MIFVGIGLLVMVLSVQCFSITYRLTGINRTLLETPISLFEVAVPLLNESGEYEAYFDSSKLESNLTYYFDSKIPKYTSDYHVYYYYSKVGTSSFCVTGKCNAIEVTLKAKIIFNTNYMKTMRFEIRRMR